VSDNCRREQSIGGVLWGYEMEGRKKKGRKIGGTGELFSYSSFSIQIDRGMCPVPY
jgi:hypothetical protein